MVTVIVGLPIFWRHVNVAAYTTRESCCFFFCYGRAAVMMHRPNVTVLAVRSMSGMGVFGLEEWRRVLHWDRLGIDRGNYTQVVTILHGHLQLELALLLISLPQDQLRLVNHGLGIICY